MRRGPVTRMALDLPTGDARHWREKLYRILVYWFHHAAQAAAWREGHLGPLSPRAAERAKAPYTESRARQSTPRSKRLKPTCRVRII
jgi:hypothetical protein